MADILKDYNILTKIPGGENNEGIYFAERISDKSIVVIKLGLNDNDILLTKQLIPYFPEIYEVINTGNYGNILVYEKMDGTLEDLIKRSNPSVKLINDFYTVYFKIILDIFKKHNIIYTDSNCGNISYKLKNTSSGQSIQNYYIKLLDIDYRYLEKKTNIDEKDISIIIDSMIHVFKGISGDSLYGLSLEDISTILNNIYDNLVIFSKNKRVNIIDKLFLLKFKEKILNILPNFTLKIPCNKELITLDKLGAIQKQYILSLKMKNKRDPLHMNRSIPDKYKGKPLDLWGLLCYNGELVVKNNVLNDIFN